MSGRFAEPPTCKKEPMTVKELTERLTHFDEDAIVYIPSLSGPCNNSTVAFVCNMPHDNIPEEMRVHIPPDVALLCGDDEAYVTDSEKIEDRMGDV